MTYLIGRKRNLETAMNNVKVVMLRYDDALGYESVKKVLEAGGYVHKFRRNIRTEVDGAPFSETEHVFKRYDETGVPVRNGGVSYYERQQLLLSTRIPVRRLSLTEFVNAHSDLYEGIVTTTHRDRGAMIISEILAKGERLPVLVLKDGILKVNNFRHGDIDKGVCTFPVSKEFIKYANSVGSTVQGEAWQHITYGLEGFLPNDIIKDLNQASSMMRRSVDYLSCDNVSLSETYKTSALKIQETAHRKIKAGILGIKVEDLDEVLTRLSKKEAVNVSEILEDIDEILTP